MDLGLGLGLGVCLGLGVGLGLRGGLGLGVRELWIRNLFRPYTPQLVYIFLNSCASSVFTVIRICLHIKSSFSVDERLSFVYFFSSSQKQTSSAL